MANKPKFEGTLAEIYKLHYDLAFAAQSKEMKERILACKGDNSIKDPDVTEFIRSVCLGAETAVDKNDVIVKSDTQPAII